MEYTDKVFFNDIVYEVHRGSSRLYKDKTGNFVDVLFGFAGSIRSGVALCIYVFEVYVRNRNVLSVAVFAYRAEKNSL